jgi:Lipase maturation factor
MAWFSTPDYWLGRLLFQRGLAVVYLIAFIVAINQFRPLLGERGLLPVPRFIGRATFRRAPSIFHIHYSDRAFAVVAWSGLALAAALLAGVLERWPEIWTIAWLAMWALYLSIVNVGQTFYGFGWESLLLEAGAIAALSAPGGIIPPTVVVIAARWLLFRLEFGAGLIKMRGDPCWRDLTCLYYHHETQPMPNPLSRLFHLLPRPLHRVEVAANHAAQLIAPVGLFAPQPIAGACGAVIIVTQIWLIASGNFSWLNVTTILLAFLALDNGMIEAVLPIEAPATMSGAPVWHDAAVLGFGIAVVALSYWPIRNMASRGQRMNFSFNPYHLVNSYGAFGGITRVREEVVIEGTLDDDPGPQSEWREYEFKGKPGDPARRSPQIAPYHLRLDWMMWFIPISASYAYGWFDPLIRKLLENDPATIKLLRRTPFPDGAPKFIRARLYRYRFSTRRELKATGLWWHRSLMREFLPPTTLDRGGKARKR